MNINPTENPNIPAELAKQVLAVRNQISLSESEIKRLSGIITSLKYEMNELVKQKQYTEDELKNVSIQKESITAEVAALLIENNDLVKQKGETIKTISTEMAFIEKCKKDLEDQQNAMLLAKKKFDDDMAIFTVAKKKLDSEKDALDLRIERLTKALS